MRGIGRLTNVHAGRRAGRAYYDDGIYTTSTVDGRQDADLHRPRRGAARPAGHPLRPQLHRRRDQHHLQAPDRRPLRRGPRARSATTSAPCWRPPSPARLAPGPAVPPGRQLGEADARATSRTSSPACPSEGNVIDQYYRRRPAAGQVRRPHRRLGEGLRRRAGTTARGGPGARAGYSPAPSTSPSSAAQNVNAGFACAPGGVVTNVVNTLAAGLREPGQPATRASSPPTSPRRCRSTTPTGISAKFTYHFDNMDLKYIGGGINYHYTLFSDNGGGSISSFRVTAAVQSGRYRRRPQPCACHATSSGRPCTTLTIFPQPSLDLSGGLQQHQPRDQPGLDRQRSAPVDRRPLLLQGRLQAAGVHHAADQPQLDTAPLGLRRR